MFDQRSEINWDIATEYANHNWADPKNISRLDSDTWFMNQLINARIEIAKLRSFPGKTELNISEDMIRRGYKGETR